MTILRIFCYIIFLTFQKRSNIHVHVQTYFFLLKVYTYQVGYVNLPFYRWCRFYIIRVHHKEPTVVDQDTTKYKMNEIQHLVFWWLFKHHPKRMSHFKNNLLVTKINKMVCRMQIFFLKKTSLLTKQLWLGQMFVTIKKIKLLR